VYHLELRQFPHNLCRFNLTEEELRAVAEPWSREQVVELGDRKWSPHQAKLRILEGPSIPIEQLSMGRGWRAAQRESEDVTERVLAAGRQQAPGPGAAPERAAPASPELMSLLGDEPARLLALWQLAVENSPGRPPSESLARAEEALRSLRGGPA
jgi:hypothetical protein